MPSLYRTSRPGVPISLAFSLLLLALPGGATPAAGSSFFDDFTEPPKEAAREWTAEEISPVADRKFWLHLNGLTIHFDKRPDPGETVNDYLFGSGFTWDFYRGTRWTFALELDVFLDSNEEISGIFGPSARVRLIPLVEVGVTAMAMYKEAFDRDYGFPVIPMALPFAQVGFEYLQLRMYYIPPVRRSTDEQLTFQLLVAWPW